MSQLRHSLAVFLLLALTAGCATGPDASAPRTKAAMTAEDYDAMVRVATTARQRGDTGMAFTVFTNAAIGRPDRPEALLGMGDTAWAMRLADVSREAYRKVLVLSPGNVEALRGVARAEIALDRPAEAATAYREALARAPGDAGLQGGLAVALDLSGDHAGAAAAFEKALALAPGDLDIRANYGWSLARRGDARGVELLDRVVASPGATGPHRATLQAARERLTRGH
ncbi:MAG TPA: tetratricopeptide repeat protein [Azospirillaceae bacterium]|nr:tetratricopeptide repeat protein [Azospirillaceae bacterium]